MSISKQKSFVYWLNFPEGFARKHSLSQCTCFRHLSWSWAVSSMPWNKLSKWLPCKHGLFSIYLSASLLAKTCTTYTQHLEGRGDREDEHSHGLRTPNESFFFLNISNILADWGDRPNKWAISWYFVTSPWFFNY